METFLQITDRCPDVSTLRVSEHAGAVATLAPESLERSVSGLVQGHRVWLTWIYQSRRLRNLVWPPLAGGLGVLVLGLLVANAAE